MPTARELVEILDGEVLSGDSRLDEEVQSIGAGDMMSDILALAKPGMVVLTAHTSPQSVRTGMVTELLGLVVVQNKNIPQVTIELARQNDFLLVRTRSFTFSACGRLYNAGFKGIDG
ncbi:MAG: DRTGG domain-containing protein [Acidobacteriota bacterium]|jgi:predicted transcriptional regulator|nr:DRTGG domain-containing protein [Acidobacteriota bacterium]